jgi:endonuclease G
MARKSPARRTSTKSRRSSASSKGGRFTRAKLVLWLNIVVLAVGTGWYFFQPAPRRAEIHLLVSNAFATNKRVELFDVAWDIYQLYYSPDFVAAPPAFGDRTHLYAGVPQFTIDGENAGRFLSNTGYLVGYSDELASPLWAAYRMSDISPLPDSGERPESFEIDRRTLARINSDVYTNTGFDRGHLAPNYAISTRYGEAAQRETFLMSNVMPQKQGLNAGLWKQLELRTATSYPARFGEIWVICGPVFDEFLTRLPGTNRQGPVIPEACYMILVDESDNRLRTLAFLFPQEPSPGTDLNDYLTTIDEIERRTGLDFLAALPDATEAEFESRPASRVW